MKSQFLPLLRNEVTKTTRRRVPYFGIFAEALLCAVIFLIGGQMSNAQTANGWGYVSFSMQLVFTDLGPVFVVIFAAMLMAEETGTGTIRAALAAPVHRWELYLAKTVMGLLYMAVISIAALLFSTVLALVHYQFGAVADSAGVVYTRNEVLREFFLGYALSWIPLGALVMYGLLMSTLIRNSGAAVASATSTLFIIEFTKHLAGIDPYVFTRYINFSWVKIGQIAQGMEYQWRPDVWGMIALSGISAAVMFAVGLVVFVRRDLNH